VWYCGECVDSRSVCGAEDLNSQCRWSVRSFSARFTVPPMHWLVCVRTTVCLTVKDRSFGRFAIAQSEFSFAYIRPPVQWRTGGPRSLRSVTLTKRSSTRSHHSDRTSTPPHHHRAYTHEMSGQPLPPRGQPPPLPPPPRSTIVWHAPPTQGAPPPPPSTVTTTTRASPTPPPTPRSANHEVIVKPRALELQRLAMKRPLRPDLSPPERTRTCTRDTCARARRVCTARVSIAFTHARVLCLVCLVCACVVMNAQDIANARCPVASCTRGLRCGNAELSVRCEHTNVADGVTIQCRQHFHALCNYSTQFSMINGVSSILTAQCKTALFGPNAPNLKLCREHRSPFSVLARSGHASPTVCGPYCSEPMYGQHKHDTKCSHTSKNAAGEEVPDCSALFHSYCMYNSQNADLIENTPAGASMRHNSPDQDPQLFCFRHLPLDSSFIKYYDDDFNKAAKFSCKNTSHSAVRARRLECACSCAHVYMFAMILLYHVSAFA
jgi:hypothetical protein